MAGADRQLKLTDLLSDKHILLNCQAEEARQVIDQLTALLVSTGHVDPAYAGDVWRREQRYPTGLPTQPVAVAIPHADPDHVHRSALAVAVLRSPVPFGQMGGDGSQQLAVRVVFLLAVKERTKQVEMISKLVGLIQSPALLQGLLEVESAQQALALMAGG